VVEVTKSNGKSVKRLNNTAICPKKTPSPKPKEKAKHLNSTKKTVNDNDGDGDYQLYPCDIDLKLLKRDEIRYFNFLKLELDEVKIAERVQNLSMKCDKLERLKPGTVAWAKWSRKGPVTVMWPCVIEKVQENKRAPPKVWLRYYEYCEEMKFGHVFKMDLESVELFFGNTREHFEYKIATCTDSSTKCGYEFFFTYTNALKDFEKNLQKYEKEHQNSVQTSSVKSGNREHGSEEKKYRVNNDMLSLSQVHDIVNRDLSQEQKTLNQKRIDESRETMNAIISKKEVKDFLVSIMKTKSDKRRASAKLEPHLVRHLEYLNGSSIERSKIAIEKMGLGPVTHDDSMTICQYLQDICKKHFKSKPQHLKNYEIDVLYYEAVIWALMKSKNIKRKQACSMYEKNIFNYTCEEKSKSICHDLLNRLNEAETKDSPRANNNSSVTSGLSSMSSDKDDENDATNPIDNLDAQYDMSDAIYDIKSVCGDALCQEIEEFNSKQEDEIRNLMSFMLERLEEMNF
jgi:hypothetical protein